jgi:hypothetical protein
MDDLPVEAHQFDFWIGQWDVFGPAGRQVGSNVIETVCGGSVLRESWAGQGGVFGTSVNSWDPHRRRWHQTWMDSTGTTLLLDGEWRDTAMVLEGDAPNEADPSQSQRHRISWTPSGDGLEVRQYWQVSDDDGETWSVAFDGRYRRAT